MLAQEAFIVQIKPSLPLLTQSVSWGAPLSSLSHCSHVGASQTRWPPITASASCAICHWPVFALPLAVAEQPVRLTDYFPW